MTETRHDPASPAAPALPAGVRLRRLADQDGDPVGAVELFCPEWATDIAPVQWNFVHSEANSLRGVHVHIEHWDYLCVLDGEMLLGLHDMRPTSPTYRRSVLQPLRGDRPSGVTVPPGVAHGFYFGAATKFIYGLTTYWNKADEFGCMWNDPDLQLEWPTTDPLLSPRDGSAPSYAALTRQFADASGANSPES